MFISRVRNFALLFNQAVQKGCLLIFSAIFAIIIANTSFADRYFDFMHQKIILSFGSSIFQMPFHHWVNDFLMAIFFLAVGMEIKREMFEGHLASKDQRLLPLIAAFGGVIFPILIYLMFNYDSPTKLRGWAIPAATDIAFALGVFALFAKNLPIALRVFLAALAIIDDLIAVLIIALFYTEDLDIRYLFSIFVCMLFLYLLNKSRVSKLSPYFLVSLFMWYYFYKSGIHATICGVILGFFIPLRVEGKKDSPLITLEKSLSPGVEYFVLPIFAFINSGIAFKGIQLKEFFDTVTLGITFGLFIGKQLGIFGVVYILNKTKLVTLPNNTTLSQFYCVALLCGIGFTMSLFVGILAFEPYPRYLDETKIGVLFGSLLSVFASIVFLKFFARKKNYIQ